MNAATYSLENVVRTLGSTLEQYLEAQYHIWDRHLIRERSRLLRTPGVIAQAPYVEATPVYRSGEPYSALGLPQPASAILEAAAAADGTGIPRRAYVHQATGLQQFLLHDKELIVSTGTGSGKTESFLLPILSSLAIERSARPNSYAVRGIRALLLYPMNALVGDQLSRLRRLLGNDQVASALRKPNGYSATFGMYTSRTPYPGPATDARNRERIVDWIHKFFDDYEEQREALTREGKWPIKDLQAFARTFTTSPQDCELLSRHEMHSRAPDILITNYSMLEYMLLRPIERSLFDQTEEWLRKHPDNRLIVVLDEAHLYQGAQGSEVALLLRRLMSRLRIGRERLRFILTSASLGGEGNDQEIREFAAALTGGPPDGRSFAIVKGVQDRPGGGRPASLEEANAWAAFDYGALHAAPPDVGRLSSGLKTLAQSLGADGRFEGTTVAALQHEIFEWLETVPVASAAVNAIMGDPQRLDLLAERLFPGYKDALVPLNALIALGNFAKQATGDNPRIFLACRLHLLYRGIEGLYACTDRQCSARQGADGPTVLGRLYATARLRCECGARVFELYTHRDCGAAYLRVYTRPSAGAKPDFVWHESSSGRASQEGPLDALDLLVEPDRDHTGDYDSAWLHTSTGRLFMREPSGSTEAYLRVHVPDGSAVQVNGRTVLTFPGTCPVCRTGWRDRTAPKIMDLVTKGEAPFAHLIASQVRIQPPSKPARDATPNAGRKSLLFSDGRQKAARLARDLPREIEQDAFRQALLFGCKSLVDLRGEAALDNRHIYPAFLCATAAQHLSFFDGADAAVLALHQRKMLQLYGGNLREALEEDWPYDPPTSFYVSILRSLGNRHYSLFALAMAYPRARNRPRRELVSRLQPLGIAEGDADALTTVWIQGMFEDYACYSTAVVRLFPRERAAGYPVQCGSKSGFDRAQKKMLADQLAGGRADANAVNQIFVDVLAQPAGGDLYNVLPGNVSIVEALDQPWFGCRTCTYLAPVLFRNACAHCGSPDVHPWRGEDDYLRARKTFWREPVRRVLSGQEQPMTLDVQEHTAQLSFRDTGDVEATTETFERRFRDILLPAQHERAIDVLSCTTTMEVGIDIGSLIGVGLRNIPPSRHNYQQRAGRAGRRGSAVSTVVTYAQNSPHDAHHFENPRELIAGHAQLLGLDVSNPALVRRHVFAELLQEYFRQNAVATAGGNVFQALGDTIAFYAGEDAPSLRDFADWLEDEGAETLARIDNWIPTGTGLTAQEMAVAFLEALRAQRPASADDLQSGEEEFIEFLFGRGLLPAYAFPRDLVSLQTERIENCRPAIQERTQQSASVALSEYAPGRLVVLNKETFRIGAVTSSTSMNEINRARRLFVNPAVYLQCENCLYTEDMNPARENVLCPICTRQNLKVIRAIQPECAWAEGAQALPEDDDEQMTTDTTVAQLPVPSSDRAFDGDEPFGVGATLRHGRGVELIMVNRGAQTTTGPSGFIVCRNCGHTVLGTAALPSPHDRDYLLPTHRPFPQSRTCHGQGERVYLGYRFRTDVLLLTAMLRPPLISDLGDAEIWAPLTDALLSLAHALALAAATTLEVDVRELQSGFRLTRTGHEARADLYLYDALAGGAGYARLAGQRFDEVFRQAQQLLERCPNSECRTSCTQCLRSYGNRWVHNRLDRRLALDLARYIQTGVSPSLYSAVDQQRELQPLKEMLELEGWSVRCGTMSALEATHGGTLHRIGLIPSLIDRAHLPGEWRDVDLPLRVFDIEKDLPSCLARVAL